MKRVSVRPIIASIGFVLTSLLFFYSAGKTNPSQGKEFFPKERLIPPLKMSAQHETQLAADIGSGSYRVKQTIPLAPAVGNAYNTKKVIINDKKRVAYCLNETDNVSVIDMNTNELIKMIPVSDDPYEMAIDTASSMLYAIGSSGLTIIDGEKGLVINKMEIAGNSIEVNQVSHMVYAGGVYLL